MGNVTLLAGFLNQALTCGFRIGTTQIRGREDVERFLSGTGKVLTLEEAVVSPAFQTLCGGFKPTVPGVFAAKAPAAATANERIVEGFSFLLEILSEGMGEDVEAAMAVLETGSIPVAQHYPPDFDAVCVAFEEAVAQARNEARHRRLETSALLFLNQLEAFTDAANSNNPMDLLTWSLRALAHLPAGWDLPAVVLELLTARMEWKMLLFGPAAETLQLAARRMKGVQNGQHDWEFEAHLHYLAGTALLVTSFSEMRDSFGEAIDEFQRALQGFERAETIGPELHERFSLCFATIGDILDSRGRHDEAKAAYKLAELERDNARQR